jgi:hypothetical protein
MDVKRDITQHLTPSIASAHSLQTEERRWWARFQAIRLDEFGPGFWRVLGRTAQAQRL